MEFLIYLSNSPVIVNMTKMLLHFVWQGFLIAFLLYAALQWINIKHSQVRYALCLFALGLFVLVPILSYQWIESNSVNLSEVAVPINAAVQVAASGGAPQQALSVTASSSFDWQMGLPILTFLWLCGIVYYAMALIGEVINVNRLTKHDVSTGDAPIQKIFDELSLQLKAHPWTRLLVSFKVQVPMVVGWFKPVVLIPAAMVAGLSAGQLQMLLAHELAHVKRHDYLVNLLQTIIEVIWFFHPCAKWVSNQVRIEREYCCDDIAVSCCGDATAYARALTDAESIRSENIPQLAMAITGGNLKDRVVRMVDKHHCAPKHTGGVSGVLLLSLVGIGVAVLVMSVTLSNRSASETSPSAELQAKANSMLSVTERTESDKSFQTDRMVHVKVDEDSRPLARFTIEEEPKPEPIDASFQQAQPKAYDVQPSADADSKAIVKVETKAAPIELAKPATIAPVKIAKVVSKLEPAIAPLSTDNNQSDVALSPTTQNPAQLIATAEPVQTPKPIEQPEPIADIMQEDSSVDVAQHSQDVMLPKAVKVIAPNYPRSARVRSIEAEVKVSFLVSRKGRVRQVDFQEDVDSNFRRAVTKALKKWRFEPGKVDGEAVEMPMDKIFSFRNPDTEMVYLTGSRIAKAI